MNLSYKIIACIVGWTFLILNLHAMKTHPRYRLRYCDIHDYNQTILDKPDHAFVDLRSVLEHAVFDIRYATANNFTGTVIYPFAGAYCRKPVAEGLKLAEDSLKRMGIGLVIYDAYRPYQATIQFWQVCTKKKFVASPFKGSRHNRGCAIDMGLVDLATGSYLEMPTEFDSFTAAAGSYYRRCTPEAARNRSILHGVMAWAGFAPHPDEWWHLDYDRWKEFDVMDVSFEQLDSLFQPAPSEPEMPQAEEVILAQSSEQKKPPITHADNPWVYLVLMFTWFLSVV
ncbi:MAG: M15 family metallopeptidase [Flavobacteriales bacterium]